MENIIIFGAGKTAVKQRDWAVFAGYRVLFFVDNCSSKWGETIEGIPIYSPEILQEYDCAIVFQDLYAREIEAQLKEMSYPGRKIRFSRLKKEAVCNRTIDFELPQAENGKHTGFVFDTYFTGLNWGGVESWSTMAAKGVSDLGIRTCLICGVNSRFDGLAEYCLHFSNEDELAMVKDMAVKIAEFLPCVFVSQASVAIYAACIVKSLFPDQIRLVVVAHGDEDNTYETLNDWSDQVEKIICISKKIYQEFRSRYDLKEDVLLYQPNPVQIPMLADEEKDCRGILQIGFAARLRKLQKRMHLLPEVIEACLRRHLDVEFNIAGEGECLELLRTYVTSKGLENRVHILGWMEPTGMADFWRKQHVYLNISDFEGMSLAMLEAMAQGAIPVVTDVSGVGDLIEDGENGFIVSVENWMEVVDKIEFLCQNQECIQKIGNYNRKLIKDKCDLQDYAKWLIRTFSFQAPALSE